MANGDERRSIPRMIGDFLREAAVLVIVFYPLDTYINSLNPGFKTADTLSSKRVIEISLGLLAAGMALERIDFDRIVIKILDAVLDALTNWRIRLGRGGRR